MTEKTLTTDNIRPALDALRGELAPWPVVAMKQDRLNDTQKSAVNSGITSGLVAQIIANTAAIRALESAITGTGLRPLVVASLPAIGTQGILYIVPVTTYDPETDADVVNYSNEYIWIVAPDAPVTEGYYEHVGQTGIVINNGQLTITVNGTSVGTFTANQSGDTTAAITVPTNADYVDLSTSQTVTGGKTWTAEQTFSLPIVGSITGTASKAIADEDGNSIKTSYGKLAGNNTWTGRNTFHNLKSTGVIRVEKSSGDTEFEIVNGEIDATTNTLSRQDDIRFYDKNTKITGGLRLTYTTDTGTKIELYARSWKADGTVSYNRSLTIYTNGQTGEYYTTLETNFLPKTTSVYSLGSSSYQWSAVYAQTYYYNGTAWGLDKANTWTNTNIFSANLEVKNTGVEKGVAPTTNSYKYMRFTDKNNGSLSSVIARTNTNGESYIALRAENLYKDGALDSTGSLVYSAFYVGMTPTGSPYCVPRADLYPDVNNTYNLGTSTNKWKTLNGVNPGALSLPTTDISKLVYFNGDITDLTGGLNSISFNADGWITILIPNVSGDYIAIDTSIGQIISTSGTGVGDINIACICPVRAGITNRIFCKCSGGSITAAFCPCSGNV